MTTYNLVLSTDESTVVAEYVAQPYRAADYQSEASLERAFLHGLGEQGYEYLSINNEQDLIKNLRKQLEIVNKYKFSDSEWDSFFNGILANKNEGMIEKTKKIQTDHIQNLIRDDGSTFNIRLIDKNNIHNNTVQVLNQYEQAEGTRPNRYDVTILVNGFPLVHVELKRRGIPIREAFNQINRYQRESFWAGCGLYEYIQIFVISNGTNTKYYSNTTRDQHINESRGSRSNKGKKTSHSFSFTSYWADAKNKIIPDLIDFTKTFFSKHTLLNVLTKYCVLTSEDLLLVMRPYQIAATERILNRIEVAHNHKWAGSIDGGGYIWHTTGSGKTLTSFKAAQLITQLPYITKVLFVVDRKDLDYQTMREYDRFQKGAANSNTSTRILKSQLEDRNARIIITTIQKLDRFITQHPGHPIYREHLVLVFDECHRSQFGDMHTRIVKNFKNYHLFGFTGTPIFPLNSPTGGNPHRRTTEQAFGEKLHTYTIVDAITDTNVLPFRIDYINTIKERDGIIDAQVPAIDNEKLLGNPKRISEVTKYIITHFDQKTKRSQHYSLKGSRLAGFNSIFAVSSIPMAMKYYTEFKEQLDEINRDLKIATIYSFSPNEDDPDEIFGDESMDTSALDKSSRDFLDAAISDYNGMFNTNFDTSSDKFENYYKDVSNRVKKKELDLLIVVNMFLTGFDATTLNTLWVDKNLRLHGLIQAFSRTNRILNSVKTFGNIVCFRNLRNATDEAIALFGDSDAGGIVLLRSYEEYLHGYKEGEKYHRGYLELLRALQERFPLGEQIIGEENKKEFISLYGAILRLRNILTAFDEFEGDDPLNPRDLQDYQSTYIDLYEEFKRDRKAEKEDVSDDVIFELELIKQIEVNIDYILMLVAKYKDSHCSDKEILSTIEKAINASIELRSKKQLIQSFLARINHQSDVDDEWRKFVESQRREDLDKIIAEENLKVHETEQFVKRSFKDGAIKTTGTDIDKILPPIPYFGSVDRRTIKQRIIDKLLMFFEKYFGLV